VSNTKDNAPCSTLFVGNLGDQVSEPELLGLFSSQPGFVTLKVVRNPKNATAFVDFSDLAAAMAVHDSQQVSSPRILVKEWGLQARSGFQSATHPSVSVSINIHHCQCQCVLLSPSGAGEE